VSFRLDGLDFTPPRQALRLFDSAGRALAFNGDDYTFAAGGTYYVGVAGEDNTGYDAVLGTGDAQSFGGDCSLRLS
jgi:hypothetical protein